VSPNGVGFVDAATRPGVLPRMLAEILDTRIMVKGAMKKLSPADRVSPFAPYVSFTWALRLDF